jgi:hypothetical protein
MKIIQSGRAILKSNEDKTKIFRRIIKNTPPYLAIIERAAHRHEDTLTSNDMAAHWHGHFKDQVGASDKILKDQAVCYFQIIAGADR